MPDTTNFIEPEVAPPEAPPRVTVASKAKQFAKFWDWEIKPKGEPKPAKWWTFWRWKFWNAPPPKLQRSVIPSLGNLMPVDQKSWSIMQFAADMLAFAAVVTNLVLVSVYAGVVASQSLLPLAAGFPEWLKIGLTIVFCLVAITTAIVMQFGTDFAIPFGVGLAGEKFRVAPTAAVALWAICAITTVVMKVDVYTGWGRERVAEAAQTATVTASDQRVLDKYRDAVPPPVASSEITITNSNAEITRLEGERKIKDAARAQEDKDLGGRGPKWQQLNTEVGALDTLLAAERAKLTAATTAKANRLEYDDADTRTKAQAREAKVAEGHLLYDADPIVWMRSVGMAFASFLFVLISFMIRGARAEQAKRQAAAAKGVETKRTKKNTFEAEYEEAAPLGAPALPSFDDAPGTVSGAYTKTAQVKEADAHPDRTGDNSISGVNGYEGGNGT